MCACTCTVYVLYFVETGKSCFYEIFVAFILVDGYVELVPRRAESNIRGFNFATGHRLAKYAKLNPPQNIRRIRYVCVCMCMYVCD